MLKVSIITVVYNNEHTISEAIQSVLNQDYNDIEYIIVDGQSKDNTINIIKSFGDRISKFVSERDNGLYDAMNKGLQMATGDVIGILNSDDIYADNGVVTRAVQTMLNKKVDIVYGDLYYFKSGEPNKPKRFYRGGIFSLKRVSFGLVPPHPTFFIKKSVYDKFGKFDTQYTLSADFDLIVRFLGVHKVPFTYLPEVLVKMRLGGKSTSSLKRIFIMNNEDLHSCKKNGVRTNPIKFYSKYFSKILKLKI